MGLERLVLVLLAACGLLWVGWEWVELAVRLYVTLRLPRVLGVEYIALERLSFLAMHGLGEHLLSNPPAALRRGALHCHHRRRASDLPI